MEKKIRGIRLTDEVYEQLKQIAEKELRSINQQTELIIIEFIINYKGKDD